MSPRDYEGVATTVFTFRNDGIFHHNYGVNNYAGIRPVLSLNSDIELKGTGSEIDPYRVVMD